MVFATTNEASAYESMREALKAEQVALGAAAVAEEESREAQDKARRLGQIASEGKQRSDVASNAWRRTCGLKEQHDERR